MTTTPIPIPNRVSVGDPIRAADWNAARDSLEALSLNAPRAQRDATRYRVACVVAAQFVNGDEVADGAEAEPELIAYAVASFEYPWMNSKQLDAERRVFLLPDDVPPARIAHPASGPVRLAVAPIGSPITVYLVPTVGARWTAWLVPHFEAIRFAECAPQG